MGKAATGAFVLSFVVILFLDLILAHHLGASLRFDLACWDFLGLDMSLYTASRNDDTQSLIRLARS